MTARARFSVFLGAACLGGVVAGLWLCASASCRNLIGVWSGRGALVGIYDGAAFYESDVARTDTEEAEKRDSSDEGVRPNDGKLTARSETAENTALEELARHQTLSRSAIDREVDLIRSQFRPPLSWVNVMRANGLSLWLLRARISANLRSEAWIENKIATALRPSAEECAGYYNSHRAAFAEPMRLRARHIFFAAPPGSLPDLVERKRALAQGTLDRLVRGESFDNLAAESEDESNKKTGGDLNFFAESRVPADFWAAVVDRRPGDAAALIRTLLGFHVVQVTDARPGREMPMEEATSWILAALQNEKRSTKIAELRHDILERVRWLGSSGSTR